MDGIELLLEQTFAFHAQQGEIIKPGVRRRLGDGIGFDVGMRGGDDLLRFGEFQESVVVPDFEARKVEGIVSQLDPPATQESRDCVAVALERDSGRLVDPALGAMEEGQT